MNLLEGLKSWNQMEDKSVSWQGELTNLQHSTVFSLTKIRVIEHIAVACLLKNQCG